MNIDTFLEAQQLYNKYSLCESLFEYLSDDDKPQGQKYLETLKMFVNVFPNDFMMFVHNKMQEIGSQFEELHCPEHSDSGLQIPVLPPSEPKEPKFAIGSKVVTVHGIGKDGIGIVKDYDAKNDCYYVVSDSFSMWFSESELEAYVEESEEPAPDKKEFAIGDKVFVSMGEDESLIGTIVGYEESTNIYVVEVKENENEDAVIMLNVTPDQLELYTEPENPEENGGTTETDEGE